MSNDYKAETVDIANDYYNQNSQTVLSSPQFDCKNAFHVTGMCACFSSLFIKELFSLFSGVFFGCFSMHLRMKLSANPHKNESDRFLLFKFTFQVLINLCSVSLKLYDQIIIRKTTMKNRQNY